MPKVPITINGKEIMAEAGSNLLETALQNGIEIPHLCYDPRIKPFGSCRLCFVDTGGPRGPVAACGTVVEAGMNVTTDNENLSELRRTALELLLSEHCGDCIAPCQLACPAHIDIQGYIALIDRKEYKKAAELIKEKMPLPSICGRVCPRFCENDCRRNLVDEPVNICDLKRFAGDYDLDQINSYASLAAADSGKNVAVVGGGPAGLTAAYYLALKGHSITLYDRGPKLGGMLRYGIPEYRLPKALLDREIDLIVDLCTEVRLGEVLGEDFTIEELREKYDAVFLGLGCQAAQGMGLKGEDMPGILRGIDFLRSVAEGSPPVLGRRVAVVGGGNTAMDAARTALRLGVEEVNVIYRRSRNEMPADKLEIAEAEEEGIKFNYLTNPVSVLGGECVLGVECVQMELGAPDESGRCRPLAVEGSEFNLDVDNVIMAIGQTLDQEDACSCSLELHGKTLAACPETGRTSSEKIFAAGDAVTGPATVVEAVGTARKTAIAIDQYLRGLEIEPGSGDFNCSMGNLDQLDPADFEEHEKIERLAVRHLASEQRKNSFVEYNHGLTEEDALKETKRCLSCGCQDVFDCSLRSLATEFDLKTSRLGVEVKRYPISKDHPFIVHDPNKCVLCANCVRICHEVQGANALCLVNRGYDTVIKPTLELPLNETTCESCGQCVSACPTGALTAVGTFLKPGPWRADRVIESACTLCGIGCSVELQVVADKITSITAPLRQDINDGNLCVKGRFEYSLLQNGQRLLHPLVKTGDKLQKADWQDALTKAAAGLEKVKADFGPGSVAVVISASLSNEEMVLAHRFADKIIGTGEIYAAGLPVGAAGLKSKPFTYEQIEESDFILVVDSDLPEDYPIIAHKIRKALDKDTKLAFIGSKGSRLDQNADLTTIVNPGKLEVALQALLHYMAGINKTTLIGEIEIKEITAALPGALRDNPAKLAELAAMFLASTKPAVIVDGDFISKFEYSLLQEMLVLSCSEEKGGILPLNRDGNVRGLVELNLINADDHLADGFKNARGVLLIGDKPLAELTTTCSDQFVVAFSTGIETNLAKADIVFPLSSYLETSGTVVNCEGRVRVLKPAYASLSGRSNSEIISELARALGQAIEAVTSDQILAGLKNCILPHH
jgi:formate dehydrogenase major subunit